jgi:hypothetical protein
MVEVGLHATQHGAMSCMAAMVVLAATPVTAGSCSFTCEAKPERSQDSESGPGLG